MNLKEAASNPFRGRTLVGKERLERVLQLHLESVQYNLRSCGSNLQKKLERYELLGFPAIILRYFPH